MTRHPIMATRLATALRVLVVDDSETDAFLIAQLLHVMGHSVEVATSGRQALQKANSFDPHLILCDIVMPEMNGFEFARCLRRTKLRPKLVVLSGYSEPSDFELAKACGFDEYIVKPIEILHLQELIESLVPHQMVRG
jgi:CheY-like chemotaxis protein